MRDNQNLLCGLIDVQNSKGIEFGPFETDLAPRRGRHKVRRSCFDGGFCVKKYQVNLGQTADATREDVASAMRPGGRIRLRGLIPIELTARSGTNHTKI
jgi:hypothetical protein